MKLLYLTLAFTAILNAASPQTFTGVITDTQCGSMHGMKGHSDAACVKICVKGSSQYAVFDGQHVLKLSDQKTPARFVAQKVKVTGVYDEKTETIKVTSIEPAAQ
jgi:hypothetical protein